MAIYEFDPQKNVLFSEDEAGSGIIETMHTPNRDAIGVFADTILYVNLEECTRSPRRSCAVNWGSADQRCDPDEVVAEQSVTAPASLSEVATSCDHQTTNDGRSAGPGAQRRAALRVAQLTQDVGQDAAVAVVVGLLRRVDPQRDLEISAVRPHHELFRQPSAGVEALEPGDVEDLVPG